MLVMEPAVIILMANRKKCSAVTHVGYLTTRVVLATPQKRHKGVTIIGGGAVIATFAESAKNW